MVDAGCTDTRPDFDCFCDSTVGSGSDADCCEMSGGIWTGGGCAVPGPFVPPAMFA